MLARIEQQARSIALHDVLRHQNDRSNQVEEAQSHLQEYQTRTTRFGELTPEQLLRARTQHAERFAPLQRAIAQVSPLILEVRDRFFVRPDAPRPRVVVADHYETPYREGGPNLYSRALVLVDPPRTPDQKAAPNKFALVVYAIADQDKPTEQVRVLGMTIKDRVPGRLAHKSLVHYRYIDCLDEPISREFMERYRAAEDLELITPEHDLFQPVEGGVEYSSASADHLNVNHLWRGAGGDHFDPQTGTLEDDGKYLQRDLARHLSSKVPTPQIAE